MPKVSLKTIENLQNQSKAIGQINSNFAEIAERLETLLSRDGLTPNQMEALLDMSNRRIINLGEPQNPTDAARHGDLQKYVDQVIDMVEDAQEILDDTIETMEELQEAADIALEAAHDIAERYLGAFATPPGITPVGTPIATGMLYYDTSLNTLRVYRVLEVDDVDGTAVYEWSTLGNKLIALGDVQAGGITDGEVLVYNSATETFVPQTLTSSFVTHDGEDMGEVINDIKDGIMYNQYDLAFFVEGLTYEAETLYRLVAVRPYVIPSSGHIANSEIAAASPSTFSLKRNGAQFGTITFTGTVGTFNIPSATTFAEGDVLSVTNPLNPDLTLRNVSITLRGLRQ